MPTLIKQESAMQGKALSNRYRARRFKDSNAMHAFLNKGDNALFWKECSDELKSGLYATQLDRNGLRYIKL